MAKLSADGTYVTVEKGDSLWAIAKQYGKGLTYKQIGAFNRMTKSPYYIYVGQKIKLTGTATTTGGTTTTNSNKATISNFGLQSDTDGILFAMWTWSKSNTENYEYEWDYYTDNNLWFIGSHTTTEDKQCTYSIPSNATQVRFRVKPKSKVKSTKNNTNTYHWTADWTDYKTFNISSLPPETPETPDVEIEDYLLTATIYDLDTTATYLDLQVVKDDLTLFKTATPSIKTLDGGTLADGESKYVRYTCNVDAGSEYKVRVRAAKSDKLYSDWSPYSENVATIPAASAGITTIKTNSETSVYLEWAAVKNAETYDIEYATKKTYFDGSNQTTTESDIKTTKYELGGLESGQEYFFRVRAVNEKGPSAWSEIVSISVGKKPAAPTTWSSTTTAITGTDIILYWVHNSEDGSSQTYADLEIYIDGVKTSHTIKNTEDEDEKDKTSTYILKTTSYVEGTKIEWRVRTSGVTKQYGDWSIQRTINVYAPPTLQLSVTDSKGGTLSTLESFPFYIKGLPGPNTQAPISYHLSIVSNGTYETADSIGHVQVVKEGDEVYSKYFDTNETLLVEMLPSSVDLQNGIEYTITCVVSMNSGLTCEATSSFTVSWTDDIYTPNAEIGIDNETYIAYIKPYCENHYLVYYKVTKGSNGYTLTNETVELTFGVPIEVNEENVYTTTGEQVFSGTTIYDEEVYYTTIEESTLVDDITLSVYRREFDGTFTEIGTGLVNTYNTVITDPHPSLDYARYRIVAISDATGAVSFYDVPGVPVNEKAVIIQWAEDWSEFDDTGDEITVEKPWSGSLLRLPYNIDVDDKYNLDVTLVKYIGRKHPITYYGTQLGSSATWSMEIEKDDVETLYALRRLAIWMGDVYVREPSGSGYWASINVSFSQKHRELTIPVTLDITRVEGGM